MPPTKHEHTLDELRADGSIYAMRVVADALTYAVHRRDPSAAEILADLSTDELHRLCIALADLRPWSQFNDGLIDEIAIQRAIDGHKVKLREVEQVAIAKRFINEGRTRNKFAELLRISGKHAIHLWNQAQGLLAYERHHDTVTSRRERTVPGRAA
ncbi:hypothetical protein [Nonomuraea sp. NPDC005650]|uniref:hypothetical protein n=1 Tax=Nonomuraea sp. NPDC005650 TaxID=3157045 RepID=UPI0033A412D8